MHPTLFFVNSAILNILYIPSCIESSLLLHLFVWVDGPVCDSHKSARVSPEMALRLFGLVAKLPLCSVIGLKCLLIVIGGYKCSL